MALNRFVINRNTALDDRVKAIVDRNYPDIAKTVTAPVNHPVATAGGEIFVYEGTGDSLVEKLVWGVSRMGSKQVVTR